MYRYVYYTYINSRRRVNSYNDPIFTICFQCPDSPTRIRNKPICSVDMMQNTQSPVKDEDLISVAREGISQVQGEVFNLKLTKKAGKVNNIEHLKTIINEKSLALEGIKIT